MEAVTEVSDQQGLVTTEISQNTQEVSTGTQEVSSKIQEVTYKAEEVGSAANVMLSSAERLSEDTINLKDKVSGFIEDIRNQ